MLLLSYQQTLALTLCCVEAVAALRRICCVVPCVSSILSAIACLVSKFVLVLVGRFRSASSALLDLDSRS